MTKKQKPNQTQNRLQITTFEGKLLFYGSVCVKCEVDLINKYPTNSVIDISHSNFPLSCRICEKQIAESN